MNLSIKNLNLCNKNNTFEVSNNHFMKNFIIFFSLLLISQINFGQTKLFTTPINEVNVATEAKIGSDLSSTYGLTRYYSQEKFNLETNLEILLPTNRVIKAIFLRKDSYSIGSSSYTYSIENEPSSELVFSVYKNTVTGMYASQNNEKIIFQQTAPTIFTSSTVNNDSLSERDKGIDYVVDEEDSKNTTANNNVCLSTTPVCSGTSRIDVMVVYTTQAKNLWGGASAATSFLTTAITNMNNALINSGVSNVTINLVYSGEVIYTESGSLSTDLGFLRNSADGVIDNVHNLRTTYGADLVAMVLGSPTSTCGLGNLNNNPTNYSNTAAFTTTIYSCVVSNYSLAHELGHNMGLNHDWYVSTSLNPCEHHHGYINKTAINLGTSSTTSQRWRTIMAYNDQCTNIGINCTRVNRWANPSLNYNSESTGVAIGLPNPSNEVFGFNRFACVVSQFMPQTLQSETFDMVSTITMYPNPANDILNFEYDESDQLKIVIYNSLGQNIIETKDKQINISNLSAGIYMVNFYDSNNQYLCTKKIIKN